MTALLKVTSCNRNTGDYYEDTYEDIPPSLLNEHNVFEPRSFSQNSRHPSQKQFQDTMTPENDMEKIDPWSGERTQLLQVQSVSSSDMLMLSGQNPTPHGLSLSDLQEATYMADDHLPGATERSKGTSEVAHFRPELHNSGDRVFTSEPELQLRLNENLGTTMTVDLNKLDFKISSLSNYLMTSPTIPSETLAATTEKTGSLQPSNMPTHFSSQLETMLFDKSSSHIIESGVPLGLSKGDNDSKLLEEALMNNQESILGENVLSIKSDRLFKEEKVHGPASLTKDNSLFKVNTSLVKTNKSPINSTTNRTTHSDRPTLLIENSTSVWQDSILKSNVEFQEVTSLIHDEMSMDKNATALGPNHVSNTTTSSKNMEMVHQKKEGPLGAENPDISLFKMLFLPDSANWIKKTHGKNSLSSGQRPSPKQLIPLGSEKSVKDQNFLSEKNMVVVEEDKFTKGAGVKDMISLNSKSEFLTHLANVQENDTRNHEKKSQEEIQRKEKLIQENVVLPQMYTMNGTKNFLKNLFLLSTNQNVDGLDEETYTPVLQNTKSLNDSAKRAGIHMALFSKIREETNLQGLGNQTKQMVEKYPSTTRISPNPSQQNVIAQRGKRALKQFRLPKEERKLEFGVILNDTSTQWSKNMKYWPQGTLTQIEYNEKEKGVITQSLLNHSRSQDIIQTDSSALPIEKASAFPAIRPTDLTKIPSQDNSSHLLALSYSYTFRKRSSGVQKPNHFLQGARRNLSLVLEMTGSQEKISPLGESTTNPLVYKKLDNTVLLKPYLSKVSSKIELPPNIYVHQENTFPTKTSNGSGYMDLIEEIFLQKTQEPVQLNKLNKYGKILFLKWATNSSEKTPSKLLGPPDWDNQYAIPIPKKEWKSQEKSQKNIAFKTKDTILPLDLCENNHSVVSINEGRDKPQREVTWAKQGGTGRLYVKNLPVLTRHQREITLTTPQQEEDKIDYDDTFSIEMKKDFDIYGDDENQGPRSFQKRTRHYFIAAVEQLWDYGMSKSSYALRNRYGYSDYSFVLLL